MNYETGKRDYESVHTDYVSSESCDAQVFWAPLGQEHNPIRRQALIHIKRPTPEKVFFFAPS